MARRRGPGPHPISGGEKFTQKMQQDSPNTVLDRMKNVGRYLREGFPGSGMGMLQIESSATPSIDADVYQFVAITALAVNITSVTVTGTLQWRDERPLQISIKDNGSPRSISWGSSFAAGPAALPTTTTPGQSLTARFAYNEAALKWKCQAVSSDPA